MKHEVSKMSANCYDYRVQTVAYGNKNTLYEYTEYLPVFRDDALSLLSSFLSEEGTAYPDVIMQTIRQSIDNPNKKHTFAGYIYYMEIIHGVATFGNDIDKEDHRPLVHVNIHDLLPLMEQWISDVKFLKEQMDQLPKKTATIVEYLKHVYNYTEQDAAKAVDYLMQAREIAVEFVYYIEHGEFIPERYASNFHGYTAKQLNNKPFLSLLGAFNYMVYLKTKPERALAHIEKSFPRRVIINAEEEAQLLKEMNMD